MRISDIINESAYDKQPYGRGIRRGDHVVSLRTGKKHTVVAVEGSKYVLDNDDVVDASQIKRVDKSGEQHDRKTD